MDYGRTTFHAVTEEQNFKTKGEHNIKSSMWLQNKLLCYSDLKERNILWTMELDSGALV